MAGALELGRVLAGYRIDAVAGRGGMGVVYRATQLALDRTVALKLIASELAEDEAFRERFQGESRVLASVDHPNVLTVYEADESDGQLFISMRWVEGTDLRRLIGETGGLTCERAARIVAQVSSALDAAHARGLVHRDVKPGNVLIEPREGSERAYLADFGLTKKTASRTGGVTATGQLVGTLDYIAPEQIEGRHTDARADVYALGCVLFEALTGRVPYPRDSEPAKLYAHLREPPPVPRELRPELPGELDQVVARAMAKDPDDRYQSAGDFGRAALAAARADRTPQSGRSVAGATAASVPSGATAPGAPPRAAAGPAAPPVERRRIPRAALVAVPVALVLAAGAAIALSGGDESPETSQRAAAPGPLPVEREPRIDRVPLGPSDRPGKMAADSRAAYVLNRETGEVVRVDRASGQISGRLDVGEDPVDLARDESSDRLWVASYRDRKIAEVDTSRFSVVGEPFSVERKPTNLAVLPEEIVYAAGDNLLRVSKRTHKRVGKVLEQGAISSGHVTDLATTEDSLALANIRVPRITTYATGGVQDFSQPKTLRLKTDHSPAEMVIDDNVAWVAISPFIHYESGSPRRTGREPRGTVLRVDLGSDETGEVGKASEVGREPQDIAIDDSVVWVPSRLDGTITRIDAKSGRRIGEPIKRQGIGDTVAAANGVVWVAGEEDLIRIRP